MAYANQLTLSGKIIKGPHPRTIRRQGSKEPMEVCGFLLHYRGSYRTTWRRLNIWVTTYDVVAQSVGTYLRKNDWVLIQGSMFQREYKGGSYFFKDGSQARVQSTEIWAHTVDLLERPWHDYQGMDTVPVPRDLFERMKAFDESRSRWDLPRAKHSESLSASDIDEVAEQEASK